MLGTHMDIVAARAVIPVERKQSGGAVTAILVNALDEGLIDAVVTVTGDPWTMKPASAVITSSDALISMLSRYSWWVPLLGLKEAVVTRKCRRIAVIKVCPVWHRRHRRSGEHLISSGLREGDPARDRPLLHGNF